MTAQQVPEEQIGKLLWTIRQAADAMSISERTLWSLADRREIKSVRIGRALRFDPADIRAYIDAQKSKNAAAEN